MYWLIYSPINRLIVAIRLPLTLIEAGWTAINMQSLVGRPLEFSVLASRLWEFLFYDEIAKIPPPPPRGVS